MSQLYKLSCPVCLTRWDITGLQLFMPQWLKCPTCSSCAARCARPQAKLAAQDIVIELPNDIETLTATTIATQTVEANVADPVKPQARKPVQRVSRRAAMRSIATQDEPAAATPANRWGRSRGKRKNKIAQREVMSDQI